MGRQSCKSLQIDPNVRYLKVYPREGTRTSYTKDLKTVGIKLSKEQAIHLAKIISFPIFTIFKV
jgi:hypothetical protein